MTSSATFICTSLAARASRSLSPHARAGVIRCVPPLVVISTCLPSVLTLTTILISSVTMILPIMAATIEEELRPDSALTVRYCFQHAVFGAGAPSDASNKYSRASQWWPASLSGPSPDAGWDCITAIAPASPVSPRPKGDPDVRRLMPATSEAICQA